MFSAGNNCIFKPEKNWKRSTTYFKTYWIHFRFQLERNTFPITLKRLEKVENWKNNEKIALNISFVPHDNNFKCKNKVILLIITDGKKWHYLAVKSLSALLWGIRSNYKEDFYCLNCFHSHIMKNKLKKHYNVCEHHDYCYVEMPNEDNKILKYNHGEKLLKAPFLIYAALECLLEKMHSWKILYGEKN